MFVEDLVWMPNGYRFLHITNANYSLGSADDKQL